MPFTAPARLTRACRRHRARGFTLIEVMITVAIVGILASVALPSYTAYLQRGRVPAALEGLNAYYARMEQRFQDNGSYVASGGGCAVSPLPTDANFTFTCTISGSGASATYTLTATGKNSMAGYTYEINSDGQRDTTAHPKGKPTGKHCWSTRGVTCDT